MNDIRILNLRDALVLKHTFISNKASNSFGIQCFIKLFCFKYWYVDHLTRRRNNYVITNELKQYSEETNKIIKVSISRTQFEIVIKKCTLTIHLQNFRWKLMSLTGCLYIYMYKVLCATRNLIITQNSTALTLIIKQGGNNNVLCCVTNCCFYYIFINVIYD